MGANDRYHYVCVLGYHQIVGTVVDPVTGEKQDHRVFGTRVTEDCQCILYVGFGRRRVSVADKQLRYRLSVQRPRFLCERVNHQTCIRPRVA